MQKCNLEMDCKNTYSNNSVDVTKPCKIKYFSLQRGIINFRRINFISNSK